MEVTEIKRRIEELERKIRESIRGEIERRIEAREEGIDYKTLNYDDLYSIIHGEVDILRLEEIAEDIMDNPNLTDVEKYKLLDEIHKIIMSKTRI